MLYRQFGDDSSIKERYPSMKRWVNHMTETKMKDYILVKDEYGDWCMPPESPELIHSEDPARKTNGEVLSTTVFYSILQLMEKFAQMNGLPADAEEYAALAIKIKDAYNKKFFNPGTAQYDNNTVTANLLSLRLGLVPDGYEDKVFANVVEKTEKDCKGHVSAGVLGIQHLMRGLTEYGGLELAYKIVTNDTYPSWGYMIKKGATTIWELWNGDTANPAMNTSLITPTCIYTVPRLRYMRMKRCPATRRESGQDIPTATVRNGKTPHRVILKRWTTAAAVTAHCIL